MQIEPNPERKFGETSFGGVFPDLEISQAKQSQIQFWIN